ncbi:MAG: helix-turn-helix domain-containing protein [Bacteroides sp.]|nr:helix-turn-helix domain-containing protein [Bacteroides sp.]
MNIADRIKEFLNLQKIAVTQFADNCDVPRPTMSQLINGRNKKVSDELIRKIHQAYPDLSVIWLMFGEGPMMAVSQDSQPDLQSMSIPQFPTQTESSIKPQHEPHLQPISQPISQPKGHSVPEPVLHSDEPVEPQMQSINFEFDEPADVAEGELESELSSASEATPTSANTTQRRIVSIIVYYSDNSYESFGPVPAH